MSHRKIKGLTVTVQGESTDEQGYYRCCECNSKTMLVSPSGYWVPDEECYKSGEDSPENTPEEVFVGEVSGHWCPTCEMLVSISYNFK